MLIPHRVGPAMNGLRKRRTSSLAVAAVTALVTALVAGLIVAPLILSFS